MSKTPNIILNNLSFHLDNSLVNFTNVNLSFESLKYGIVGWNGAGKSTFLKLLSGELVPSAGTVLSSGQIASVPQNHQAIPLDASIAHVLGIEPILQALHRIRHGSIAAEDFQIAEQHWDLEEKLHTILADLNLSSIDLHGSFHQLSGGEKTKILLAKTRLTSVDFLLFDEPTNNLDSESRDIFYRYVDGLSIGVIIASHDRVLLNQCERILEITTKGINLYGGNYDFYHAQKQIKQKALEHNIQACTEKLMKSKQVVQTRFERHAQKQSQGRSKAHAQLKAKGQYNKIEIKSKKGRSENTNRRIRQQADRKLQRIKEELNHIRNQQEITKNLSINLSATAVPNNKEVISIESLNFHYADRPNLIADFNFILSGPQRMAIMGKNGCGKSTLIKLIRGLLKPCSGNIRIGVKYIAYLDQSVSFLDPNLSIVDNFMNANHDLSINDAYAALAAFKFRNKQAEKSVGMLSGGEKMRAGLAVSLMSKHPPQLLILDEPTNHLDIEAVEAIEQALMLYQGALLAVSHDARFLENIYIDRYIELVRQN